MYSIRTLREADAALYKELRLNALIVDPEAFGATYERDAALTLETFAERLKPSKDKFVLGAVTEDDRLVGIVTFIRDTGMKTAHKGNVYGMYVAPEARGSGLGKALLLELVSRARTCDGLEQIHLTVVSGNDSAKKLYEALGFEIYGVEPNALKWQGRYWDEDLMVLRL
ncbi:GNAT family N-acetyltransferase [Paenibacillus arenilitoris]|uniref:GNAT family N-acetyltransferase n=1 Tax=Paenibacillus arenilitoris TaxID=2772299 RepID=A0A927CH96_9BACL|nr:GNAT family N-acetyltransferase [Paenibacillus arenilitoris]MBD2867474.1 GNAT family N-acetyltransferase [Paenibacillus arenilitoris]